MYIGDKEITFNSKPFVIAEMSANHNNSLDSVMSLMEQAKATNVSAFKLQTYSADSITFNSFSNEYLIKNGPWKNNNLFSIYKKGEMPLSWLKEIFHKASELNLETFSTPFSMEAIEILEEFKVNAYKVASFEITYIQLLREIGSTKKPVILSTGMASYAEINEALDTLYSAGTKEIALLKCTTSYPAKFEQLNLDLIEQMKQDFKVPIGFSDHTISTHTGALAVMKGATILEKHIKLDGDSQSLDSEFALPVSKLAGYIQCANDAWYSIGKKEYGPFGEEKEYLRFRRSIIVKKGIKKGQTIMLDDLVVLRPNVGLSPKYLDEVIGKKANKFLEPGQGLTESDLIN